MTASRLKKLELEILHQLTRRGHVGVLGLEDHCDLWTTPRHLRESIGYLLVEGYIEFFPEREGVADFAGYAIMPRGRLELQRVEGGAS
jgi:hypothetical protein